MDSGNATRAIALPNLLHPQVSPCSVSTSDVLQRKVSRVSKLLHPTLNVGSLDQPVRDGYGTGNNKGGLAALGGTTGALGIAPAGATKGMDMHLAEARI